MHSIRILESSENRNLYCGGVDTQGWGVENIVIVWPLLTLLHLILLSYYHMDNISHIGYYSIYSTGTGTGHANKHFQQVQRSPWIGLARQNKIIPQTVLGAQQQA